MAYSAIAVANYFLERADSEGKRVDQMKLQKLVYYAHGWHLALRDAPLIRENVEAWDYGPVVPELYHALKEYGADAVPGPLSEWRNTNAGGARLVTPAVGDSETEQLLDRAWQVYGHLTGPQLSAMTHRPDTPWTEVRRANPNKRGVDIPDSLLKTYFKRLAEKNAAAIASDT